MHFEELWEQCELLHQKEINEKTTLVLVDELMMKLKLYQHLDSKTELPPEELQSIKSRTMGEILWTLTKLSMKDNINVFEALGSALQFHNIGQYNQKYQP